MQQAWIDEDVPQCGYCQAGQLMSAAKVSVFVNGQAEPCLVVDELSDRSHGSLGVWVGEGSAGYFANLHVTRTR